ncbi:MAG: hypothetical protein GY903_19145 [Fuerstiella sp.]|nr:hypothetical protein [Fuerstiella sp.]MCP4856602.1 hypothetical protein [Fuerstiella sp.]
MFAFIERRTLEHIERVRKCLSAIATVTPYGDALNERAEGHDLSRFGPEERIALTAPPEQHLATAR